MKKKNLCDLLVTPTPKDPAGTGMWSAVVFLLGPGWQGHLYLMRWRGIRGLAPNDHLPWRGFGTSLLQDKPLTKPISKSSDPSLFMFTPHTTRSAAGSTSVATDHMLIHQCDHRSYVDPSVWPLITCGSTSVATDHMALPGDLLMTSGASRLMLFSEFTWVTRGDDTCHQPDTPDDTRHQPDAPDDAGHQPNTTDDTGRQPDTTDDTNLQHN